MEEVKEIITSFRKKRNWNKYDSESSLAKSIIIEAAELLEHFQWNENNYNKKEVSYEIADILIYSLAMCYHMNIDPKELIKEKLKDDKKIDRWQKIAEVAAKQSKRNIIPKVENLITMEQLKNEISEYDLVLIAYENERKTNIKEVIKQNPNAERIGIVIGPEGGMSIEEVKNLEECGAKTVGLGKRILRTETAPITMISMLIYEYEF